MRRPAQVRADGRRADELRPCRIEPFPVEFAEGSAMIHCGRTRVLCTASVQEGVPRWMERSNKGWLTAEYSMLPRATTTRTPREAATGRLGGRTQEIQRLIGRSLRAAVNLDQLGPVTITIDCDVLQADGGTRTAAITGGYVALALGLHRVFPDTYERVLTAVAAVSVGVAGQVPLLDLDYSEDSSADVDLNVVRDSRGGYIEIQGTGERTTFDRALLDGMLLLADKGVDDLLRLQQECIKRALA